MQEQEIKQKVRHTETLKILQAFNAGIFSAKYTLKLLGINCKDPSTITIGPQLYVNYGSNVTLGENFDASVGLSIIDHERITIGNNVECGSRVTITTKAYKNSHTPTIQPITIGNNVVIGEGVIILPGVTIGDNVVIDAGVVINQNIPANSIVSETHTSLSIKTQN